MTQYVILDELLKIVAYVSFYVSNGKVNKYFFLKGGGLVSS